MNSIELLMEKATNSAPSELVLGILRDIQIATHSITEANKLLEAKVQKLTYELAYYRRIRFGASTEAFNAEQLQLFEDDLEQDIGATEAELESLSTDKSANKKPHPGRQALPSHLERVEVRHDVESCACPHCQSPLQAMGEDISEQLDVEPARFFVVRHIRPKYVCRQCETIIAAPVPPAVIDGGMATPGVLTWLAIGKFVDHLPLYRLEQIAARSQINLSRSTLSNWIGRLGFALTPLVDRLTELIKQGQVLHADETPVQQLNPKAGKTHRAYLWAYRTNELNTGPPIVVFDYQTSRSGQHAASFLQDWQGTLMVDDYSGYKHLFRNGVTELGWLRACAA